MKKLVIFGSTGLALALSFAAPAAWAGYKNNSNPVVVNVAGREASGSMGTARASSDVSQYIGCVVTGYGSTSVACYAADAAGNYMSCSSTNASYITAATAITLSSYLDFVADASGNCTYLRVYTSSMFAPPTP